VNNFYIYSRPGRLSDMNNNRLQDERDAEWEDKAKRLQARRWKMIKRQEEMGHYSQDRHGRHTRQSLS